MMLLKEIISGKRKSPFILLADNADQGGINLLNAFIQSYVDQKYEVHVACFELPISSFMVHIRTTKESKIHYHDFFTDHLGWLGKNPVSDINAKLTSVEDAAAEDFILVIDSVAAMIMNSSSATVYKVIQRLISSQKETGSKVQQIIGLLHKDMLGDFEVADISHLAYTILKIQPPKKSSHGRPLCYIKHRAKNGKSYKEVEHYSVDSCNILWSEKYKEAAPSLPEEPVDPMADVTTFKLSLGDKEKEARSQLVLPYLRKEGASDTAEAGVIHYVPDEGDDWDEEDPDNDLNI